MPSCWTKTKKQGWRSSKLPAVQQLIGELDIRDCLVTADALNCQRETAEAIVRGQGDYLLDAKGNQPVLEEEIREYVQDESLRKTIDCTSTTEKSRDRVETRTAYTTADISWLFGREKWKNLCCIGAIKTEFERKGVKTEEWHYYISSRNLSAQILIVLFRKLCSTVCSIPLLFVPFCKIDFPASGPKLVDFVITNVYSQYEFHQVR